MRIAYVHGFAGVNGSMLLGALIDAGAPLAAIQEAWHHLQFPAVQVTVEQTRFADYAATRLACTDFPRETFLSEFTYATLYAFIEQRMRLPRVRQHLLQLLTHFADAVARVHRVQEPDCALQSAFMPAVLYLGSGVAAALEALDIDQLMAAPVNLGVAPHPLTATLVRGASVYGERTLSALTTVDGAAILSGVAVSFGPLPSMTMVGTGYGVSAETSADSIRGLQVLLGETEAPPTAERIAVLEANIDDMNPEFYEAIFDRLLTQGALDVTLTPLLMKKGRPANTLTVLAPLPAVATLSHTILLETSTFGVRVYEVWRQKLERFSRPVETRYGIIPVKCGVLDRRIVQAAPEYDACKHAALAHGVPVRLVYTEATRLAAPWLTDYPPCDSRKVE